MPRPIQEIRTRALGLYDRGYSVEEAARKVGKSSRWLYRVISAQKKKRKPVVAETA